MEETLTDRFDQALSVGDRDGARTVLSIAARRAADLNRHGDEGALRELIDELADLQTRGRRRALLEETSRARQQMAWEATGMATGIRMAAAELSLTMVPAEARRLARRYNRLLKVIGQQGPISTGDLMRVANVNPSTLSDQLRRLERLQLVERIRFGREQYDAHLTPFGEAVLQEVQQSGDRISAANARRERGALAKAE